MLFLTPILSWLGNLLGGPFATAAVTAYKDKLDSENSTENAVAGLVQREMVLQQAQAQFNAQVVTAEQGNWFTRWVRPMWAAPFVFYTWKVVVWDICLGWGSTDPIKDASTLWLMNAIAVSYFGGRTIEKSVTSIASAIRGK